MTTALSVALAEGADQHFVQFYEAEPFLCTTVADFMEVGVRAGQPILALATAPHRDAFSRLLEGRGHDVAALNRDGRFLLVDARTTLAKFMRDGMPDPALFAREVGALMARVPTAAPDVRVRAYGEMVDLLWQDGNGAAAIRLEELWNELGARHPLTLLCTYAIGGFDEAGDRSAFQRICGTHSHVTPAESYHRDTDPDARLREVAALQQRAQALATEIERSRGLEQDLRRRNAELERTLSFSEMFVGSLGHDLRNPLSGVTTAARLLARRADSDKVAKPAKRILSSAERMARMIDQLLDFTRIRVGQGLPLERASIDLEEICRLAIDELGAAAAGVSIEPAGDLVGQWDGGRLTQLVSTLVDNALVHGSGAVPVRVRLDGSSADAFVRLEVANAGAVPPEMLPTIFLPRVHAPADRRLGRSSGLGLGLFIGREIVVAHAGTIDVASSDAEGTRMTVRLPRQPVAETAHDVRR